MFRIDGLLKLEKIFGEVNEKVKLLLNVGFVDIS